VEGFCACGVVVVWAVVVTEGDGVDAADFCGEGRTRACACASP